VIRSLFASLPEAKTRGYKAVRFSFNAHGGCCDTCRGHGCKWVEMHFLPDEWVTCAASNGSRYNHQTVKVTYHGSIADVLKMEVQEALEFFTPYSKIATILQTLCDVGLKHIKLGQSALTLSGGEAQRVKLAKELSRIAVGNVES
jgi:excinuclease ABC subunit A